MVSLLNNNVTWKTSILTTLVIIFVIRLIFWDIKVTFPPASSKRHASFQEPPATTTTATLLLDVQDQQQEKAKRQQQLLKRFGIQSSESDIAYLDHCHLDRLIQNNNNNETTNDTPIENFKLFFRAIINETEIRRHAKDLNLPFVDVHDDLALQTLELYARAHDGVCDFTKYERSVPINAVVSSISSSSAFSSTNNTNNVNDPMEALREKVQRIPFPQKQNEEARIVFMISTFEDFQMLEFLVDAIHLPHHIIIIHLERRTEDSFAYKVRHILTSRYDNVIVIQYGTITYPTDSITHINLDVMRWVTIGDLSSSIGYYDYYICLSSSSYPLWGAREMAKVLKQDEQRRIRVGQVAYNFEPWRLCQRHSTYFGLVATRGVGEKRRILDWKESQLGNLLDELRSTSIPSLPEAEKFFMKKEYLRGCVIKTTSGNTAAYDRQSVIELLSSPEAMELLTRFKLSGGCCHEESSWGGAWGLISNSTRERDYYIGMMKKPGAMWQAWPCTSSIGHNYVFADRDFPNENEENENDGGVLRSISNRTNSDANENDDECLDPDSASEESTCIQIFDRSWLLARQKSMYHIQRNKYDKNNTATLATSEQRRKDKIEDCLKRQQQQQQAPTEVHGKGALQEEVVLARERGMLFAQKFTLTDRLWIDWIRRHVHQEQ